jgi:exodeoxyribonuclease V alpha subunit
VGGAALGPDEALPDDLRVLLGGHDIGDDILWAAWEVTTWAADAPLAERRALGCLVVGLLDAIDAGGTFLPLAAPTTAAVGGSLGPGIAAAAERSAANAAGTGSSATSDQLEARLRRMGLGQGDRRAVGELAARLVAGTAPPAIAALFGPPGSRHPFILSHGGLYPERLWRLEERVVTMLRARLARTPPPFPESLDSAAAAVVLETATPALTTEQVASIRGALANPLTIIAGGPGTGKTTTIVGLLRTLVHLGVPAKDIALAAPTGRAASRMKESVDAALAALESPSPSDVMLSADFAGATTLHRLLGISPGRGRALGPETPEFFADWPLPQRIVIVDEASMIDLVLAEQLLAAVNPDARLILIGDSDQLPSVQVGAVFRDLVAGLPAGITCILRRSHRMNPLEPNGAAILRVAASVNTAAPDFAGAPVRRRAADLTFAGFERLAPGALDTFLDRWQRDILGGFQFPLVLSRLFALDEGGHVKSRSRRGDGNGDSNDDDDDVGLVMQLLGALLSARIMCVTREVGRTTSAASINRMMHTRAQSTAIAHGAAESLAGAAFIPGEPVIMLRNDQARGLFNGDLGVVLRLRDPRGSRLGVAFARGDGFVVHALDAIAGELALAFALTVHKAQGSEYDRVALVLPDVDVPLLTREVVYTALTRARRSVVVVGDPALLELAITRSRSRTSGIAAKLTAPAVS